MSLEIQNLTFTYPNGTTALDGVSLTVEDGETVAIIGHNGAGKTTLAKSLNGIIQPSSGDVILNGTSVTARSTAQWAPIIGYVFQNPDDQLFLDTVREEMTFGPRAIGMPEQQILLNLEKIADLVGLSKSLEKHPFDLTAAQKKFCTIGSVLMMSPSIVVFDEPTCGQDAKGNLRLGHIIESLTAQGITCLTISHDMEFVAEYFKRTIVMAGGKALLDQTTEEVFAQPEILKESYVTPPAVTRVAQAAGLTETPLTVSDLIKHIRTVDVDGNTRKSLHARHG